MQLMCPGAGAVSVGANLWLAAVISTRLSISLLLIATPLSVLVADTAVMLKQVADLHKTSCAQIGSRAGLLLQDEKDWEGTRDVIIERTMKP